MRTNLMENDKFLLVLGTPAVSTHVSISFVEIYIKFYFGVTSQPDKHALFGEAAAALCVATNHVWNRKIIHISWEQSAQSKTCVRRIEVKMIRRRTQSNRRSWKILNLLRVDCKMSYRLLLIQFGPALFRNKKWESKTDSNSCLKTRLSVYSKIVIIAFKLLLPTFNDFY